MEEGWLRQSPTGHRALGRPPRPPPQPGLRGRWEAGQPPPLEGPTPLRCRPLRWSAEAGLGPRSPRESQPPRSSPIPGAGGVRGLCLARRRLQGRSRFPWTNDLDRSALGASRRDKDPSPAGPGISQTAWAGLGVAASTSRHRTPSPRSRWLSPWRKWMPRRGVPSSEFPGDVPAAVRWTSRGGSEVGRVRETGMSLGGGELGRGGPARDGGRGEFLGEGYQAETPLAGVPKPPSGEGDTLVCISLHFRGDRFPPWLRHIWGWGWGAPSCSWGAPLPQILDPASPESRARGGAPPGAPAPPLQ